MDGKGAMHTNATNTSLSGDKIRDNKQQIKNNKECNAVHFWWKENRRERCTNDMIITLNPSSSSSLSSYHQIVISNMLQLLDLCLDVSLSFLICLSSRASAACWPCTILILNISYSSTFQFILYNIVNVSSQYYNIVVKLNLCETQKTSLGLFGISSYAVFVYFKLVFLYLGVCHMGS